MGGKGSLNELMNDEAVYRAALALPGSAKKRIFKTRLPSSPYIKVGGTNVLTPICYFLDFIESLEFSAIPPGNLEMISRLHELDLCGLIKTE